MAPDDLDLNRDDIPLSRNGAPPAAPPPVSEGSSRRWLISAAVVLALVAGGVARWWTMDRTTTPVPAPEAVTPAPTDMAIEPEVALPPLEQMDPFLRTLLGALSARPELARWLATDGLIQQMALVIDRVSRGATPARQLGALAPGADIQVDRRGRLREINPASFRRYDGLAETLATTDPAAVAVAYRTIQPRLNEAYRNLGRAESGVDIAVQQALDLLISTPIPEEPIRVVEGRGATWAYADPALEALSPAQKQLLRMGPQNEARVIDTLKQVRQRLAP